MERRRLWGRAQGRPLSAHQEGLVKTLLPEILALPAPLSAFEGKSRVTLEIGFGGGEHLLRQAQAHPDQGYIGAEPFLNGVAKALSGIDAAGLDNIRLHHGDVRAVLDELPDNILDCVYILYPDPWPKPRHYKRRLIQEDFIADIYRVLKPGGELRFASDIISYVDWALARILRYRPESGAGFSWDVSSVQDWLTPYAGWSSTRYEAKALREGRTPHYFTFMKT
ncbi:MAG: tRNA (guanosine(46)-N7)-methyltransferase TrmB [Robiginitomaculum sp.]|nr:MAG: tRNA (guanosine(46)-N7)-methyltransferase TrmB [Robiginitomaculum sp.]